MSEVVGTVYLVGAGPGDPGLLTVKGQRCLQRADVIIYDRLVNPRLLDHASPSAECIYAGKDPLGLTTEQEAITSLLVERARAGQQVVRLKGGDPFVFGRGGEEASALAAAGIPFEVVPGVSAAIAVPTYAGIPVTDRRSSSSFTVIGGARQHDGPRGRPRRSASGVEERGIADTLVSLMSVGTLPQVVEDLLASGVPPTTPAAMIEWGTTPRQRTIRSPLEQIVARVREAQVLSPATLVVGPTVALADSLAWFENKPLFGWRVGVSGTRSEVASLAWDFEELGAEPVCIPSVLAADPDSWDSLDRALARLDSYDWVLFDSPEAVHASMGRLRRLGRDVRAWAGVRIASLSQATTLSLEEHGLLADATLSLQDLTDLAADPFWGGVHGACVLLASSSHRGGVPYASLVPTSVHVDVALACVLVPPASLAQDIAHAVSTGLDVICFTSRVAVENVIAGLGPRRELLRGLPAVCGDLLTAASALQAGCSVISVGDCASPTNPARALVEWYRIGHKEKVKADAVQRV